MHQIENTIRKEPLGLRQFIPVAITFFIGLVLLSLYQNIGLYAMGVLDRVLDKSLLLLVINHLGFASISALVLAFVFNIMEIKRPGMGLRVVKVAFIALLVSEALLTTYYLQNYEALGIQLFQGLSGSPSVKFSYVQAFSALVVVLAICYWLQKKIGRGYGIISRMYPVTIIMFSLFLATLYSDKKEINENKTNHLLQSLKNHVFDFNPYTGEDEYPLLRPYISETSLAPFFNLTDSLPHIKVIIMEGLGSDFVGSNKPYRPFMPFLNQLQEHSLSWANFLSNTGEGYAALGTVMGSLPFGQEGFTKINVFNNRNTLFSILGDNGYTCSFAYGGNGTLYGFDKFLEQEQVDLVLDKNSFGPGYEQQDHDAAGHSLGYPDAAMYNRYQLSDRGNGPKLDVLVTLSTMAPYLVPQADYHKNKVEQILERHSFESKTKRFVSRHQEIFASFLYADRALQDFMAKEQLNPDFKNTVYIITGSHCSNDLPQENRLTRYRVPFLIYSNMLNTTKEFKSIASHADIAPTLIDLLHAKYQVRPPSYVAWLGDNLAQTAKDRHIPFLRGPYNLQEYIIGNHFLAQGKTYVMDSDLGLTKEKDRDKKKAIQRAFDYFRSVNAYVTENNKILPEDFSLIKDTDKTFTKEELVWIQSVFSGTNFDNAYLKAHNLAMDKQWERAKLLCRFILNEIPRHADTEILLGRLHGWQQDYTTSISILEKVVRKYPKYTDAYCALMDSYFWAGKNEKVDTVKYLARENGIDNALLIQKFKRAERQLAQERTQNTNSNSLQVLFEGDQNL